MAKGRGEEERKGKKKKREMPIQSLSFRKGFQLIAE